MTTRTLADIEAENTQAALRGDPALLYALLDALRRSRDGLSEADVAESRERAGLMLRKDAPPLDPDPVLATNPRARTAWRAKA